MSKIWFAADHHFQHANILKFIGADNQPLRPNFKDIRHHDNTLIAIHNHVVASDDIVYFLGDVTWKTNQVAIEILEAMKGRKRLVCGNHDDLDWLMNTGLFEKHYMWKYFPEYNLVASHVPLGPEDMKRGYRNVHGHMHERYVAKQIFLPKSDDDTVVVPTIVSDNRYLCVSMERIGYKPIDLDTVLAGLEVIGDKNE